MEISKCLISLLFLLLVSFASVNSFLSPDSSTVEPTTEPTTEPHETSTPNNTTSTPLLQAGESSNNDNIPFKCSQLKARSQRKLCTGTGLKKILLHADFYARKECENRFKSHQWRCYGFTLLDTNNITKKASKESSFVYSLSSAILTHTIAEACTFNRLTCTIESRDEMSIRTLGFIDNDVPDNVLFAMDLSRRFFDEVETRKKSLSDRQTLNLHNNKIGRQALYENVHEECRCHGLSAGCAAKTCNHILPDRSQLSAIIYLKYKSAVKVSFSSQATIASTSAMVPINTKDTVTTGTMVFMDKSLNFCYKDNSLGSNGVKGNRCNVNQHGSYGNCVDVCCGRGFAEIKRNYTESVCKFEWCCRVKCTEQTKTERVYVCS